jgi:hypothetical protein
MDEVIKSFTKIDDNNLGIQIVTNLRTMSMTIEQGQSCCEQWGFIESPEDLDNYIGAFLLEASVTDTQLDTTELPDGVYVGSCVFVTFETSLGSLQFTIYNEQSGYYGHEVRIDMGYDDVREFSL